MELFSHCYPIRLVCWPPITQPLGNCHRSRIVIEVEMSFKGHYNRIRITTDSILDSHINMATNVV